MTRPWGCCAGWLVAAVLLGLARSAAGEAAAPLVVGAKNFTEGAVLGELMAQVLEAQAGVRVERRFNLAGTQVAFDALRTGAIDVYAEYTGTGLRDILGARDPVRGAAEAFAIVSREFRMRYGLMWLAPFGFNNTYVLLMRRSTAAALGVRCIGDLGGHSLRYGMSYEFLERQDGMPALRRAYPLDVASLVGMEHALTYAALADGAIDVSDGYSTDAKLVTQDLVALGDDRGFFPPYQAAPVVQGTLPARAPGGIEALLVLAGRIDEDAMRRLNRGVEVEGLSPHAVAAQFLADRGLAAPMPVEAPRASTLLGLLWQRRVVTLQLAAWHLVLTGTAAVLACLVAVPLGVAASRRPRVATIGLAVAGVLQTVPSIALLAFMLPVFGVGARAAIVALFLYGLLPILRNTITGVRGVDPLVTEVGVGLGMTPRQLLWRVELPLATPVILAGIRTSTVINVGTATLAAFIGAGGLGEPIVTGLTITNTNLVLSGALPAAVLALAVDGVLAAAEHRLTPRGLRLRSEAAR